LELGLEGAKRVGDEIPTDGRIATVIYVSNSVTAADTKVPAFRSASAVLFARGGGDASLYLKTVGGVITNEI